MIKSNEQHLLDTEGLEQQVPLLDGSRVRYVNLDNAATTPPLIHVVRTIREFLPYYSSVHRGTGFKSRLSTGVYEQAHEIVAEFVGADRFTHAVIFVRNATEALNKLAHHLATAANGAVLTTTLEHHSNDLPWRGRAEILRAGLTPDGRLDEADFDRQLDRGGIAIVAVSGASNVTGYVLPIHRLAEKAHRAGAKILVDAAQLAPHRRIDMKPLDDPQHLDFVAFSAHKMYAPYGTGVLIGPKQDFCGAPDMSGGGTVDLVTLDTVDWAELPDREEAGSPNVIGAVSLAAAASAMMAVGMDVIAARERELTRYAVRQLQSVPGIILYSDPDPAAADRLGVIPFNLTGKPHALVAAVLGYEGGIGVRNGCFCAHPYVSGLLRIGPDVAARWHEHMRRGRKDQMPGMVRASLGIYNTREDVDRLVAMLRRIAVDDYQGHYRVDPRTGEYHPIDGGPDWNDCFAFFRTGSDTDF